MDPGFPIGGGTNHPGGDHQYTNLPDFLKNCMKLRKFWSIGGVCAGDAPLDPPLGGIRRIEQSNSRLTKL